MFVRGKIQIKFGTDASLVTRLIGQVFSESLRPLPATVDFSLFHSESDGGARDHGEPDQHLGQRPEESEAGCLNSLEALFADNKRVRAVR